MIRTYMLSIPIISLCFASIQAMDTDTNHEMIEHLTNDIYNNNIDGVKTALESNPELAHAYSSVGLGYYPILMFATERGTQEIFCF